MINKGGRPFKEDKKKQIGLKLPPYLITWLNDQEKSKAVLIEEALNKCHKIEKLD